MTDGPAGGHSPAHAPYEFLGELGQDDTGRHVFLARDRTSAQLVAVRVEASSALTVLSTLDTNVPAGLRSCPICGGRVRDWRSFCGHCGSDIAGVSAAAAGIAQAAQVEEVLRRANESVEVLGEMRRADSGVPVCFGRDRQSGKILALSIHAGGAGQTGQTFDVMKTTVSPALSQAASAGGPAGMSGPIVDTGGADAVTRQCGSCGRQYGSSVRFCAYDGSVLHVIGRTDDLIGQVIADRYHVLEKIGQGGMGLVYLAEHVKMGRRCAIKVMHRNLSPDLSAISRFGREAANASRINHPNVATIYDFGETKDNLVYLAMEYVEGAALARLIERGEPIEVQRAVAIARQIADALDAAHRQRVVHRDLKPDNILIGVDHSGRDLVKVVDFGIAKAMLGDAEGLTRTGAVIGTPRYMSPEQLIAEPVDGRSDIYSLGCILFELLVGDRPFGDRAVDLPRRLTEAPPHPRDRNAAISSVLDALVVKAIARKPDERFQSAGEMRDALSADFTAEEPSRAGARGFLDRVRKRSPAAPIKSTGTPSGEVAPLSGARSTGSGATQKAASGGTPVPAGTGGSSQQRPVPAPSPAAAQTPPRITAHRTAGDEISRPGATARDATQPRSLEQPVLQESIYAPVDDRPAGYRARRFAVIAVVLLTLGGAGTAVLLRDFGGAEELPPTGLENGAGIQPGNGGTPLPAGGGGDGDIDGVAGGGQTGGTGSGGIATVDSTQRGREAGMVVGGARTQDTASVGKGDSARIVQPLPEPSYVLIATQLPAGAAVLMNGRAVSPVNGRLSLPADVPSTIEIRAQGFVTASWSGVVAPGEMLRWSPVLQPVPPPPPRNFAGTADSIIDRFRSAVQSGRASNLPVSRMVTADVDELRTRLGPGTEASVRRVSADSARGRVEFLLTIRTDTSQPTEFFTYVAEFRRSQEGWQLMSVTRQRN